ncbi:MAG: biosynthetic-type acetolactate synthase large subunit, partial [Polaromonas sp.]|nr:biosynthetic-type acetolactate synthase large subunit [Polaromonas sp.]
MEITKAEIASAAAASVQTSAISQDLRGAEILVKSLQAENVKYIWGYPGGAVLHIYDAFYKQNTIEHVLVRHEQAAVHAADGYARATGEVGVALVTSGPGVTNAITGIATAYMDSIPMVIITGQVPTHAIGLDAFQECDTVGITRPIVKHNFLVKDAKHIAETMKKAFHIARSGRPGPVVVDIPKDVSFNKVAYAGYPQTVEMRSYNPSRKGHGGQIRKALQLLMTAKRPYIYTGGGVLLSNASAELRTLVDMLGYPCTNTLMGLGAYPASDPKFLGMLGMHGTYEANNAMQNCDVLLAVGARFDDRVIGNPKHFAQNERKIIHIDIDPSSISKRVKVDIPIVGDVKDVLTELIAMIKESGLKPDVNALSGWWSTIDTWRQRDCMKYSLGDGSTIKPQYVVETLCNMTKDADVYITSDVGQHQMWAAQ